MPTKSCPILFFFQILALFLITVNVTRFREKLLIFLTIFYTTIAIFTLIIALVYKEMIFDVRTTLGAILDIIQLAIPVATQILTLIESVRKRETLRKIWEKIIKISNLLHEIPQNPNELFNEIYKKFFWKFFTFNGGATFIEMLILIRLREDYPWLRHRSAAFLPSLISRSLIFLYILHVDILGGVSREISEILRRISNENRIYPSDRRCVKICWKIVNELWLCEQFLRKTFALSILGIITSYCILLTVDFYWNFKAFFRASTNNVLESSLCSIPFILTLIPLVFSGETCKEQRKKIFVKIFSIQPKCASMATFGKFLRNFTLSGLHGSFELKAWEFMSIDLRLLSEMVQTIGIYLTIFIQFEITYYGKYGSGYVYVPQ
uniref:Gustatory receptor n=1 Tax=Phlebotomus papatasi TaxID=29031 RepID=A0A240SYT7_PHLPP